MHGPKLKWWEYIAIPVWVFGGLALFFGSMWTAIHGPLWAGIIAMGGWFLVSILGQAQIASYKREYERAGDERNG